ncbi:hypothetical protein PVAG01_02385 [Phlyctema vagabunda]|uniref:Uncharacterized protein n=1 Tax=Phlyctema vagabunda TaxID=108571 RepID=A0ABR4PQE4_9HELO
MVAITDVRASNATIKTSQSPGRVSVFVGATSGIGQGTLRQLAKSSVRPKAYIVGRSKKAATAQLEELRRLNPEGEFIFIETDITLIKNVDTACEEIKSKEERVDLLFMSPGYLGLHGRLETSEGIDIPMTLRYYSRLRFVYNLLPQLKRSDSGRVVAILAAGKESAIDINDLEVRKEFSMMKAAAVGTTQTTLAFEELAKGNPDIAFVHKFPGLVATNSIGRMLSSATGLLRFPATVARIVLLPILKLFASSVDEAGERGLFVATSARYPPARPNQPGVPLPQGLQVAQASVTEDGRGNGVYRLSEVDDGIVTDDVLGPYRADGTATKNWETTLAIWERALGRN